MNDNETSELNQALIEKPSAKEIQREAWLERRRKGIGGSDVAGILGISPWATPLSVWMDKTGRAPEKPASISMQIGTALEPLAAECYEAETGRKVRKCNVLLETKDPEDHRVGNVDRLVCLDDGRLPYSKTKGVVAERALEIKTSRDLTEWDDVPDYYKTQIYHYMGLMPTVKVFDVPVLFISRGTFRIYTVTRDDAIIADLATAVNAFWRNQIEKDEPPAPVDEADIKVAFPRAEAGKVAVASEEIEAAINSYRTLLSQIKESEKESDRLKTAIETAMADAETLVLPDGRKLASWKNNKDSTRTDWKAAFNALAAAVDPAIAADIIGRHTADVSGTRVFRLLSASAK